MMTRDPECRIIFIADTNHIDPDHLPNLQLAIDPKETLMHETAHVVSMAYDVVSGYPYVGPKVFQNVDKMFAINISEDLKVFSKQDTLTVMSIN